jgi:hypothetical protein
MLGVFGIICGLIIIVGASAIYVKPEGHTVWGTLILAFSILSLFGTLGGFVIGFILGLAGGVLALVYSPHTLRRVCVKCGLEVAADQRFCSNCGADLRVKQ